MRGMNMKFRGLRTKKNCHSNKVLLFLALISTFIVISHVHAATYNYYFSNTVAAHNVRNRTLARH